MAVENISLPNLGTELALIESTISNIVSNIPADLYTYVTPCFIFKGSEDCSTFYLDDKTVYETDQGDETVEFFLNVTYVYRTICGDVIPCPSEPMTLNGRLEFENTYGDGKYCVQIEVTASATNKRAPLDPPTIYTKVIEECLTQDCCRNDINDLRREVAQCMADFACNINTLKVIGRSVLKLEKRYLKMSNILWVIDNTNDSCESYHDLKCLFKKI
jgi:hypothetical protein